MINVTGGRQIYGIDREINEIIIDGKPWKELIDEAGYIERYANINGDKVDLKLGCKELNRDLYTGLIETTDGRKWIRKYGPPYPLFIPSGTDWIYIGYDWSAGYNADGHYQQNGGYIVTHYMFIRFRESVDICFVKYNVMGDNMNGGHHMVLFVTDHKAAGYEVFYANVLDKGYGTFSNNIAKVASPNHFGAKVMVDESHDPTEYMIFEKNKIILDSSRNTFASPQGTLGLFPNSNHTLSSYEINYDADKVNDLYVVGTDSIHNPWFGGGGSNGPFIQRIDTGYYTTTEFLPKSRNLYDLMFASRKKIYKLYTSSSTDEVLYWLDSLKRLDNDIVL